jgi:Zn-dependent M28 family amino/carboxypeptidase
MFRGFRFRRRAASAIGVLALGALAAACENRTVATNSNASAAEPPKVSDFSAARAFEHMKTMCELGPRPSGSAAIGKAQDYIQSELKSYGLKVVEDAFAAKTPRGTVPMKNIIAELPGEKPEMVLISGHYDTKRQAGFIGANDGASSTAAVLETARVLSKSRPEYTLWFVFFDGEEAVVEWGAMDGLDNTYGSRRLVARMQADGSLSRVRAMILYDMVGDKNLDLKRDAESSAWLVDTIWNTARLTGAGKFFLANETAIEDDHVPFRNEGISAVDLIDFDYGPNHEYWHSNQDTLDKVSGESVKIVGDVVLHSLPEIFKQLNSPRPNPQPRNPQ